jgi:hypothetical protein
MEGRPSLFHAGWQGHTRDQDNKNNPENASHSSHTEINYIIILKNGTTIRPNRRRAKLVEGKRLLLPQP